VLRSEDFFFIRLLQDQYDAMALGNKSFSFVREMIHRQDLQSAFHGNIKPIFSDQKAKAVSSP